jgi:hypothetical protein
MRNWEKRVDFMDISSQGCTPQLFDQSLGEVPKGRAWFFRINYNEAHHLWDRDGGRVDPAKIKLPARQQ